MEPNTFSTAQRRRVSKPLIEKRRRARINRSLSQLVEMVAKPAKIQENRSARYEKAYILELTVDYLRRLQDIRVPEDQTSTEIHNFSGQQNPFQEGYRLCMSEVKKFIDENFHSQTETFPIASLQIHLGKILNTASAKCLLSATSRTCTDDIDIKPQYFKPKYHRNRSNMRSFRTNECDGNTKVANSDSSSLSTHSTEDDSVSSLSESDSSGEEVKLMVSMPNGQSRGQTSNADELDIRSIERFVWRPW